MTRCVICSAQVELVQPRVFSFRKYDSLAKVNTTSVWLRTLVSIKRRHLYVNTYISTSGVSQGSTRGSLLYLVYTPDIPTIRETKIGTFSADTAIF